MLRGFFQEDSVFEKTFIRASLVFLENQNPEKVDFEVFWLSQNLEENDEMLSAVDVRAIIEIRREMHNALVLSMRKQIKGCRNLKWKQMTDCVKSMISLSADLLIAANAMINQLRPDHRKSLSNTKIVTILSEYSKVLDLNIPDVEFLKQIQID
jgi:hypothetical protein